MIAVMSGRTTSLIVAGLMCLLAACGGDDRPSKAEFIKEADRTCQDSSERLKPIQAEAQRLSGLPNRQALMKAVPIFGRFKAELNRTLSELRAKKAPKGDEMVINRYLQGAESQIGEIDKLIAAGREGSVRKFNAALVGLQARAQTLRGITRGYGFKVCGASTR